MFFFFKQKTAYEMRISDWSSDVCSSDLFAARTDEGGPGTCLTAQYASRNRLQKSRRRKSRRKCSRRGKNRWKEASRTRATCAGRFPKSRPRKIGRAAGRERVCP